MCTSRKEKDVQGWDKTKCSREDYLISLREKAKNKKGKGDYLNYKSMSAQKG